MSPSSRPDGTATATPPTTAEAGGPDAASGHAGDADAPSVSVVIPSMDEGDNLRHVLAGIDDSYEVVVVEGGDVDATGALVAEARPGARVIPQTRRGKGNAMMCGAHAATGDILVMLDGDGSAAPAEIPRFVCAIASGADVAKGSRYLVGGGSADLTALRSAGNVGLRILVNLLFRTRFTDLCYGFNAFTREMLPLLSLPLPGEPGDEVWGDGFEIETLLSCRIAMSDARVVEVPSYEYPRLVGASNLHAWRDGRRVLRTIVLEWMAGLKSRRTRIRRPHRARAHWAGGGAPR